MVNILNNSVINAPLDEVWAIIRDFNGMPKWHPLVIGSKIENNEPADKVSCVRVLTNKSGQKIKEKLLALSDIDHTYSYSIEEATKAPIEDFIATMQLLQITDGDCTYIEWTAEFDCAPEDEEDMVELFSTDIFQSGIDALKDRFN